MCLVVEEARLCEGHAHTIFVASGNDAFVLEGGKGRKYQLQEDKRQSNQRQQQGGETLPAGSIKPGPKTYLHAATGLHEERDTMLGSLRKK